MSRLSTSQRSAIEATIRDLATDALSRGMPEWDRDTCNACADLKPKVGFVNYTGHRLCNDCAVAYEIKTAEHEVNSVQQYIQSRHKPAKRS